MGDLQANIETDRLPFVPCIQDADGWAPATVLPSKLLPLVACGVCAETRSLDEVEWVTPEEARQRFGWRTGDSTGLLDPNPGGLQR